MKKPSVVAGSFVLMAAAALAACPAGEQLLKNKTPLSQLCPNGFGQFSPGTLADAMQKQQNNTQMIIAAADKYGVPEDLALAVAYHESEGFNSCAGSDTGVHGPMQLTKSTGNDLGFNRDINEENIQGGMLVLKSAYQQCGYDYACLASAYNGSSRPGEQQGWAKGVKHADEQLKNNPDLVASACNGACATSSTPSVNDLAPVTPSASDSTQQIAGFA